jgi:hypothetical protein
MVSAYESVQGTLYDIAEMFIVGRCTAARMLKLSLIGSPALCGLMNTMSILGAVDSLVFKA